MKVIKNAEKKGIELYFDNKPEQNIIDMLKANKFRWHNIKKCWYAKESLAILEVIENIKKRKNRNSYKRKRETKIFKNCNRRRKKATCKYIMGKRRYDKLYM